MANKKLILQLIQNDLKNTKLILSLQHLGIDASEYYMSLKEIILEELNFKFKKNKDEEEFLEVFIDYAEKIHRIDVLEHPEKVVALTDEIYNWLLKELECIVKKR